MSFQQQLFVAPTARGKAAEKDWQRTLTELLDTLGWSWMHVFPLRTEHGWRTSTSSQLAGRRRADSGGWPDLVCFRREFIIAIEVKGYDAKGRPTAFQPGQVEWLETFVEVTTGRAWVLRPTDDFDLIVKWLRWPAEAPKRFGYEVPQGA